jgi:DNA-binding FadR family transcriptional regulator
VPKKGSTEKRPHSGPGNKDQHRAYLRVADSIRLRILTRDLKPGDRLPSENDLAREEGVGRTTAREALRLLASVGLIETKRGARGGAFVTHPSVDELYEIMITALSLMTGSGELGDAALGEAVGFTMPLVARIACDRGTDEEIATLVELATALPEVKTNTEWSDIARQFSTLIIDMSRNRVLSTLVKAIMSITLARWYEEDRDIPGWKAATAARYLELADSVKRRAPAAAEEAMIRLRQQYIPGYGAGAP